MPYTQDQRQIAVETTFGPDALLLTGLAGDEEISRPFRFTLDLASEDKGLDPEQILGTAARVTIALPTGGERVIHGVISRFRRIGTGTALASYQAEMVPWLWMLSLGTNCRIFQEKTVPEIVTQVFKDLDYADYKMRLVRTYPPREFCVQYRETHLDFVSRLLEDEGIFYYFEHEADRHTLVLTDTPAMVQPCPGLAALKPATNAAGEWDADAYTQLSVERAVHTRSVTLTDYNFLTPSTSLEASIAGDGGAGEAFDYPGGYADPGEGSRYARLRLEAAEAERETAEGTSGAPALTSGHKVDLLGYTRPNGEPSWLVLRVNHSARQGSLVAGDGAAATFEYENSFVLAPADVPWRPPRRAPRPRARGTQSALVVGPAGEEIYTDEHGRVKLHFYWDRESQRDENSSCWVRCSTAWAGRGYGQLSVPRIGQEVLVDFFEGDPDRPIVVGRVYNAEQQPPCDPGGSRGVVSGLRTKTHKGSGYNAIEMNDTAGKELMSVHAQFDMASVVEHDQTDTVNNSRTTTIAVDDTEKVGANQKIDVGADQEVKVGANQTTTVGGNRSLSVDGHDTNTVSGNQSDSVSGNRTASVSGNRSTSVSGNDALDVGGNLAVDAGSKITVSAGANVEVTASGDVKVTGTKVEITGTAKITLSAGGSTIEIGPSGITIQTGAIVNVQGATIKLN